VIIGDPDPWGPESADKTSGRVSGPPPARWPGFCGETAERLDRPEKNCKFSFGDLEQRNRWSDYRDAFEQIFNKHEHEVGALVDHSGEPHG
jgi:hypothetical protein